MLRGRFPRESRRNGSFARGSAALAAAVLCLVPTVAESAEVRYRALLDESQVVRPPAFQPPVFGTGSPGTAICDLVVDDETGEFLVDVRVRDITPDLIDNSVGENATGLHVHMGARDARGPVIIDIHHYARELLPETNGLTPTDGGFRLRVEGTITPVQGAFDTGMTVDAIIAQLEQGNAFVAVHTVENDLTRTGAIRGHFERVPDVLRMYAMIDESQVVRPPAFQPPVYGTGSPGTGVSNLVLDTRTLEYTFDIAVDGIAPELIDNSVGPNSTGLHVHTAARDARGPVILDVHHYSRVTSPETNGLDATEQGFRVEVSGAYVPQQGEFDAGFTAEEFIGFFLDGLTFVAAHTVENDLTRTGAIRGNYDRVPANTFVRGDCDASGDLDVSDAVATLQWLFLGGDDPACLAACDVTGAGSIDIASAVYHLVFLFAGGDAPAAPFPACGAGTAASDLDYGCAVAAPDCP